MDLVDLLVVELGQSVLSMDLEGQVPRGTNVHEDVGRVVFVQLPMDLEWLLWDLLIEEQLVSSCHGSYLGWLDSMLVA